MLPFNPVHNQVRTRPPLTASMCFPRLFMSYAALLSSPRLPAMIPASSEGSAPVTSRPVTSGPSVPARSAVAPCRGPGPFCPKK